MAFESAEGAQAPLGFFDPLGLLKNADEGRFNRLRFVELKHGRIAQLGKIILICAIELNNPSIIIFYAF
jgi:hypothetical protein